MAEAVINLTEGSGAKATHTWSRTVNATTVQDQVIDLGEQFLATYSVGGSNAPSVGTTGAHLIEVMAGASLNVRIRRIRVWQLGLAGTAAISGITIIRLTTAGSGGTALTPAPLDTADAASGATAMLLPSSKGTEGTLILQGTAQFIQTVPASGTGTAPLLLDLDFDTRRSKPLIIPAGTSNGIAVKMGTGVASATAIVVVDFVESAYL